MTDVDSIEGPDRVLESATRRVALYLAGIALLGGVLSLAGWIFDVPVLRDWEGNGITIKTNTALSISLAAAAAAMLARQGGPGRSQLIAIRALAGTAAVIGLLTLSQHVAGWNLGIDTLLFSEASGARATAAPNRMGPPASTSFALIGSALLCLTVRRRTSVRLALLLGTCALFISSLSLIGYAYGAHGLFDSYLSGIALQTAFMLHALSWAVLALAVAEGVTGVLISRGPVGSLARVMTAIAVILPVGLGYVELVVQQRDLVSSQMAAAGAALITVVVLVTFILGIARHADRASSALRASEARLRQAHHDRLGLLESERAARIEAEQAARSKDEFVAMISHELRTPLNSIFGWSQVLKRLPQGDPDSRRALDAIERGVRAQSLLVEDLLEMSRIVSGKLQLAVQHVEPSAIVLAAIETVGPAAEAKRQRIEPVLDPQAGPVMGDPRRLQQVVWNLLANAVKFSPPSTRIEVSVKRVGSSVEITVSDSGAGVSPEHLPYIFDRYRQADSSLTRRYGGLGLGLAIAKTIVELHAGTIAAESGGEGLGSRFTVRIPIADQPSDARDRTPPWSAGGLVQVDLRGVRVVLIDDDEDSGELAARLLSDQGATVEALRSGADGLAAISAHPPDIVLCDLGMPGMDGFQVIRQLRVLHPDLPAVAVTAFVRSDDRAQALEAGYTAHVSKPVEPLELLSVVAALTRRPA